MNDRYLFRGKDISGKWHYGDAEWFLDDFVKITNHKELEHGKRVIPETVGQCTGKKYNDGKLMFEGDIAYDKQDGYFYIVKWFPEYAGFYFADGNGQIAFGIEELEVFLDNLVVMGNIHDNPELLKCEENNK